MQEDAHLASHDPFPGKEPDDSAVVNAVQDELTGRALCVLVPLTLLAGCRAGSPAVAPPTPVASGSAGITRTLLSRQDIPGMPDWEMRLFLIDYPPGVTAPRHVHPALGVGYVLEGRCESAFEGEAPAATEQGHSFVEKTGPVHVLFRNPDPEHRLRFLIAYTIRKGEQPVRVL